MLFGVDYDVIKYHFFKEDKMKKTMALLLAIVMMTAMAIPASAEAQTITTSVPGVFGDTIVVETVADENGIYSVTVVEN